MMLTDPSDEAIRFLTFLFGDKPADAQVVLCWPVKHATGQTALHARAFTSLADATTQAITFKDTADVYVGVGLQRGRTMRSRGRGTAQDIVGLVGLWADIDVSDAIHKKSGLPPTQEAALNFLDGLPFLPSLILWSGHGLQAWWAFREPWIFEDRSEWARAELLASNWEGYLHAAMRQKQWIMDSTCDLARVLRVAGTLNHKAAPPVPTRILELNESRRYNPSDIETFLIDTQGDIQPRAIHPASAPVIVGNILEDPNANPPFDKFEAMLAVIPRTRHCWEQRLKDLADDSMSTHNMSLAVYALQLGWSDQEVVDLVIAHRRKHGVNLKIGQTWMQGEMSWYRNLLVRAHGYVQQQRAEEVIDEHLLEDQNGQPHVMSENRQAMLRASLAKLWEINILSIQKFLGNPLRWGLETPLGAVTIGIDDIMEQRRFRKCIAEATEHIIKKVKDDRWDAHAQAFLDAAEAVETGPESEPAGLMRSWLSRYLESHRPITIAGEELQRLLLLRKPFRCDYDGGGERTYLFAIEFRHWIGETVKTQLTERQMGILLTQFGAKAKTMACRNKEGKQTSRYVWGLPEGWEHDDG